MSGLVSPRTVEARIDGRLVRVPEGTTILRAAQEAGIRVPSLCDHPALTPVGACRLCAVEVEGSPKLLTACTTPLAPGMAVRTDTPRLRRARRGVLELLLARHPLECFSCPSNGDCALQDLAYELGVERSPWAPPSGASRELPREDSNPFIVRDMDKCILCGRCVRACDERAQVHAIDFRDRGIRTRIGPPPGLPLEESDCTFCGQCVPFCPVGALAAKPALGRGRPWELETTRTVCPYCGVGCELEIRVNRRTGRIADVRGSDPVSGGGLTGGRTCVKGRFAWQFVHSPDRLTRPLIREGGSFREASWEEALSRVAEGLADIRDRHGGDAIGFLSSARCTNEENYLLQRLAREVFRTNNVDHCARLCHSATVAGLVETLGSGAMTDDFESLLEADLFLVLGSNTTETHPVLGSLIKRRRREGAGLIVCDPRRIELAELADLHLRHRSGSDVALLNGMMRVILTEGLEDRAFLAERTENFPALRETVDSYPLERVEEITGVPAAQVAEAARRYARGPASAILYTMGITQHVTGTDNVRSLANLALLCGMLGRPGTGVNPLRGQNNVQGACDMGCLPTDLPGYRKVTDPEARARAKALWGTAPPERPGLSLVRMMAAAGEGSLKALYVMGENPMVTDPDTNHVRIALNRLDLLIVQDIFLTETAQMADVVLPAACWGEKEGTTTNTCRAVQRVRKALEPPGEARPDGEILIDLANRLGAGWTFRSASEVFDAAAAINPAYGGLSHARLEAGPLQWPCPTADHPGTRILHVGRFPRPSGRAAFAPAEWRAPHEWPDRAYPFLATTGRNLYLYHSGSMTRRSASGRFVESAYLEIHPADAEGLGVAEGDRVRAVSRRGAAEGTARLTDRVPPGMVFLPFHFGESPANALTASVWDPTSETPPYKISAVRIERIP